MTLTNSILIVGQDWDTNQILERWLSHVGYTVLVVDEADSAPETARVTHPRLIITNYPARLSRGGTVVEAIRAIPELARTPVLNLTNRAMPQDLVAATAAGVDRSLPMPVALNVLADEIVGLIGPPGP